MLSHNNNKTKKYNYQRLVEMNVLTESENSQKSKIREKQRLRTPLSFNRNDWIDEMERATEGEKTVHLLDD